MPLFNPASDATKLTIASNLSDLASVATAKTNLSLNNVDNTSDATKNAAVATLTNKTLTSPVINSPTGFLTGAAKITVGTSTPSSPTTGDIWIDTN